MNRAYSVIEFKAVNDDKRTFRGIASTPSTDRMGDIVEPKGAEFKLPIPLLWQHDSADPIGWVRSAKVTSSGIEIEGEIASVEEDGPLKQRLSTAWQMMKSKLVRGLSIGFNPIEHEPIKGTYGLRFLKWNWLELSAVTIPANQDATVTSIKSIDSALLAASGRKQGVPMPGVTGKSANPGQSKRKGHEMKTLQEMRQERETKAARMNELQELRQAEGRAFSEDEGDEFDTLLDEVKGLDDEIRVAKFHAVNGSAAKPVETKARSNVFVKNEDPDEKFKGQGFTRFLQAKALSYIQMKQGNFVSPAEIAQKLWGKTHPKLVQWIKAGVAGGGTGSGEWGAELAQSDARYMGDFITYLYSQTVYDRLALREVPARVNIKGQDGAATGYWVGESKAIPVSKPDFSTVELTPLKVAAMAACSKELVMDSSPSAELWIRDSIVQAAAQRIDTTFLSTTAAVSGVSPAGLLNGLTGLLSSGVDGAAVRADVKALYRPFITAKNASGLTYVMNPATAKAISLLVNALGQTEFPGLNASGGTLMGDPVVTGDNVAVNDIILLKPSDIWKIGDMGIEVEMSDQATIEQDSSPAGAGDTPTAASATLMSLWQTDQVGFKVTRRINYAKRRTSAVAYITDADYDTVES